MVTLTLILINSMRQLPFIILIFYIGEADPIMYFVINLF